jgi:hypothetical protein
MKYFFVLFFVFGINFLYAQDSNVLIGLNGPSYGVKIKNNFPSGTGSFARAFMFSNQDASVDFIGFGAYGKHIDGISSLTYGFIGSSYSNPFVTFFPDGKVGIGTATPKEQLSVNGKIRAHEIKVEIANWPDYVFSKDYQLPSLQETENHIKEKGHLLGIPSAEEVKTNGVDLGEMNSKLLKKIEELTLYLIDQNKLIQTQQKLLEQQQKSIETIQLKLK